MLYTNVELFAKNSNGAKQLSRIVDKNCFLHKTELKWTVIIMNVENVLREFDEFVKRFVPESTSYIVKKDAARTNMKRDLSGIFRHMERKAMRKKKGKSLTDGERNKILKLSLMRYADKYGYRSFIVQIKTEDYYSVFLKHVLTSVHGFHGKIILSVGSGICVPEVFAMKMIFSHSRILCLDFSKESCRIGKKIAREAGVPDMEFVVADAENLPLRGERIFDIIWLVGSLSFKKDQKYKKKIENLAREAVISL